MNPLLHKNASLSLLWNAGEAFFYQAFFLMHQLLLFSYTSQETYGSLGVLFASLYFSIMLLNGAFDNTLALDFLKISENKNTFKVFLKKRFLQQSIFLFCSSFLGGLFLIYAKHYAPAHLQTFLSFEWILLLSSFIFFEGTKKNIRALLHLAFKNKSVALIEIGNIIMYISLVWISFCAKIVLTPYLLTMYFVGVSCVTTFLLTRDLYHYYQTLPFQKNEYLKSEKQIFILPFRFFIYANQVCRSLFSSNFLLPFFAYHAGFKEAGILTLINTLTFSTTFFVQKIFGPTSAALFANTMNLSFDSKQSAFSFIHKKCLHALYTILLLFFINGLYIFYITQKIISFHILVLIILFFCAHILETLFIVYEKLFVAEHKSHYILLSNVASFTLCIGIAYFLTKTSLILTLLLFMFIRLFTFFGLTFFAKKLWNLSSTPQLTSKDLVTPLLFSLFLSCVLKCTL